MKSYASAFALANAFEPLVNVPMTQRNPLLNRDGLELLRQAIDRIELGFKKLPPVQRESADRRVPEVLFKLADRLQNNFPYFHPLYAGQMLKPPHPVARLAYTLAMWINPNNHALDGGRATSAMEKESVAELARMFGWRMPLGHLTSGGTMANLEALWVAGLQRPGKLILASDQAHYTHHRITQVLGLPFSRIKTDRFGRMDLRSLARKLETGKVGTVVATMGTTATGAVDDLPAILKLQQRYGFRIHADAAYGGYFILSSNVSPHVRAALDALALVDSLVIDPHKHGLQPYGCGCVLFRDPSVGKHYKHDSPYTYFSSKELHLGEISLECSRPGAAAAALWATQQLLPLVRGGEFSLQLDRSRSAALELHKKLSEDGRFITASVPDLDIVNWIPAASSMKQASKCSVQLYRKAATLNLHLALAELPAKFFAVNGIKRDQPTVTCLRSVLMKPEHLDWMNRIWKIIDKCAPSNLKDRT